MHYLILISADIPSLIEDEEENNAVAAKKEQLLKQRKSIPEDIPSYLDILLSQCDNQRDTFSRSVATHAKSILEPYDYTTTDPDYTEFCDKTQELKAAYQKSETCLRLPDGRIVDPYDSSVCERYTIRNGPVFQRQAGPLHHEKRTKSAKRIKVVPNYPIRKLYPNISDYASEYFGCSYYPAMDAYGYYYNPNAFYDWYSIGGRWPFLFLVKDSCPECSIGEKHYGYSSMEPKEPEGYKWVCAARKRDIEWEVMADWYILTVKKKFQSLEKLFLTGERDDDIRGIVTDAGIEYDRELICKKDETEEQYLERSNLFKNCRYTISFYAFLGENGLQTPDDLDIPDTNPDNRRDCWLSAIERHIESLPDDIVLIGIDCHK